MTAGTIMPVMRRYSVMATPLSSRMHSKNLEHKFCQLNRLVFIGFCFKPEGNNTFSRLVLQVFFIRKQFLYSHGLCIRTGTFISCSCLEESIILRTIVLVWLVEYCCGNAVT